MPYVWVTHFMISRCFVSLLHQPPTEGKTESIIFNKINVCRLSLNLTSAYHFSILVIEKIWFTF